MSLDTYTIVIEVEDDRILDVCITNRPVKFITFLKLGYTIFILS